MQPTAPLQSLERDRHLLALWLFGVAGLVAVMVMVGGITRLTDSGLSITSWKPIHGALPPLSLAEWEEEFTAYRQIPEYRLINKGMSLDEFKAIFWWEWGHRNLGRLIGLAYGLPFLAFWIMGRIPQGWFWPLCGLFALGGLQGFIGWWMVASGLTERTDVSQIRLAVHLTLALIIYAALLRLGFMALGWPKAAPGPIDPRVRSLALVVLAMIFVQIVLGALVAGTDAGLTYNTWPLIDGRLVPEGLWSMTPWWQNFTDNVTLVQFNHRIGAYALLGLTFGLWWLARRRSAETVSLWAFVLLGLMGCQVGLGIATLLAVVPLWLGVLHQFGAVALLSVATILLVALFREPQSA